MLKADNGGPFFRRRTDPMATQPITPEELAARIEAEERDDRRRKLIKRICFVVAANLLILLTTWVEVFLPIPKIFGFPASCVRFLGIFLLLGGLRGTITEN